MFLTQSQLGSILDSPKTVHIYIKTRMKTFISSKAFCSITDRQTDKIFTQQMFIYEGNLHKKMELYLNQGPRKLRFSLNLTDGHTDRRTDISVYRVASLIIKMVKGCFVKLTHENDGICLRLFKPTQAFIIARMYIQTNK